MVNYWLNKAREYTPLISIFLDIEDNNSGIAKALG
jgi:hypothetical protein